MGALKTLRFRKSSTSRKSGRRIVLHVVGDTTQNDPKIQLCWYSVSYKQ